MSLEVWTLPSGEGREGRREVIPADGLGGFADERGELMEKVGLV